MSSKCGHMAATQFDIVNTTLDRLILYLADSLKSQT